MCGELYDMGFRIKELKLLRNTIKEIAITNNVHPDEAVPKFFRDIDEQYDDKLGFESKIVNLRSAVDRLTQEENKIRAQRAILPSVGPSLAKLIQKGVSEQDIVYMAGYCKEHGGTIEEVLSTIS